MAAFGLADEIDGVPVQEDEDGDEQEKFEVFPENWPIATVFWAMSTQWERMALANGRIVRNRLIYEALPLVLACVPGVKKKDWPRIFVGLHVMETSALKVFAETAEREKS